MNTAPPTPSRPPPWPSWKTTKHRAKGKGLRRLVESTPGCTCAGLLNNGEDALKPIPGLPPDVILIDINLTGMSGFELTARLKSKLPALHDIMVTVYRDHDRIFAALKAGACGYLLKRSTPAEVREAIHAVRAGWAPMSAGIARRVAVAFHQTASPVTGLDDVKLSRHGTEILEKSRKALPCRPVGIQRGIGAGPPEVYL